MKTEKQGLRDLPKFVLLVSGGTGILIQGAWFQHSLLPQAACTPDHKIRRQRDWTWLCSLPWCAGAELRVPSMEPFSECCMLDTIESCINSFRLFRNYLAQIVITVRPTNSSVGLYSVWHISKYIASWQACRQRPRLNEISCKKVMTGIQIFFPRCVG